RREAQSIKKSRDTSGFLSRVSSPTQGGCCDHFDSGSTGGASEPLGGNCNGSNQTPLRHAPFAAERSADRRGHRKADTEKGSAEAVHPGAAAYYDNNEESFMDRYGDWLYITAMAFSGLGSVIAAMLG